ncbi:MAG: three-Cys-motif partner protein TcmP [Candidatus Acidiferrales bacterium]
MRESAMGDHLQFDRIGYWSEVKLEILKKYAKAYSTILAANQPLYHIYIDAFAGAGIHVAKTTEELVPGTPLNALSIQPPFREYHLIDISPVKVKNLESLVGRRSDVFIYEGDCNRVLLETFSLV